MDMSDLYTQIILEHSRNKDNVRELENPDVVEKGHNPSCGDEITLQLELDGDIVKDISFTGHGCAISQASTSIMCDEIRGKTVNEAKKMCEIFIGMIKRENPDDDELELIGDAAALENISNMPQRVKCALLARRTLEDIINSKRI